MECTRAIVVALVLAALALFIPYWRSSNDCDRYNASPGTPMKAIVYCDYGSPDVLRFQDIEEPVPNLALIKVRAASVNPFDWHFMRGTPYVMRMGEGLRKPKSTRLGVDFAGTVEAVGRNVTEFKPGDDVFGETLGPSPSMCVFPNRHWS